MTGLNKDEQLLLEDTGGHVGAGASVGWSVREDVGSGADVDGLGGWSVGGDVGGAAAMAGSAVFGVGVGGKSFAG